MNFLGVMTGPFDSSRLFLFFKEIVVGFKAIHCVCFAWFQSYCSNGFFQTLCTESDVCNIETRLLDHFILQCLFEDRAGKTLYLKRSQ